MSERKMNIMVMDKEDVRAHLTCRGYGEREFKWLDDHWDTLCDFAEARTNEPNEFIFKNGLKNLLTNKISRETGKNGHHCYIQEIMWFSVKDMLQLKSGGPHGRDMFFVESNPIPKATLEEYLLDEETWDMHLSFIFEERDWGFFYNPGSATMEDHGDTLSIQFEVY